MDDDLKFTDFLIVVILIMFWPIFLCTLMIETNNFNRRCEENSTYWK